MAHGDQHEHWQEFCELDKKARSYLRGTAPIPSAELPPRLTLLLRIWHYPSREVYRSWSVFQDRARSNELPLRQVTWDRPADYERLTVPLIGLKQGFHTDPKTEVRDRRIDRAPFEQYLKRGRALRIPVLQGGDEFLLDGERFGIEDPCRLTLEWQPLDSASEITAYAKELIDWLANACVE